MNGFSVIRVAVFGALLVALAGACASGEANRAALENKQKAQYHFHMASGYFEGQQIPDAIAELQECIKLDPNHADGLFLLGFIHMGRQELMAALGYLQRAVEARPDFREAKNNLGVVYLGMERWEQAISVYNELIADPLYGTPFMAHNNIGWAFLQEGRLAEAEEQFRKAVFFNPKFCVGYNNLGITLMRRENYRDAKHALGRALSVDEGCRDGYAEPHLHLGRYYEVVGDLAAALGHYERCHESSADSDPNKRRCAERHSAIADMVGR